MTKKPNFYPKSSKETFHVFVHTQNPSADFSAEGFFTRFFAEFYAFLSAACAAERRAIGTRNGEQLT